MDTVVFDFTAMPATGDFTTKPADGAYCNGMFLEVGPGKTCFKYPSTPYQPSLLDLHATSLMFEAFPAVPYLEGCQWDAEKMLLIESDPKVLYTDMPVFWQGQDWRK